MSKRAQRTTTVHGEIAHVETTHDGLEFSEWAGSQRRVVRIKFGATEGTYMASNIISATLLWLRREKERVEDALRDVDAELAKARGGTK